MRDTNLEWISLAHPCLKGDDPLHHTKIVINGPFETPARCMYSKCSLSSFNDPKAISILLEQPSLQHIL